MGLLLLPWPFPLCLCPPLLLPPPPDFGCKEQIKTLSLKSILMTKTKLLVSTSSSTQGLPSHSEMARFTLFSLLPSFN